MRRAYVRGRLRSSRIVRLVVFFIRTVKYANIPHSLAFRMHRDKVLGCGFIAIQRTPLLLGSTVLSRHTVYAVLTVIRSISFVLRRSLAQDASPEMTNSTAEVIASEVILGGTSWRWYSDDCSLAVDECL